jgi:hypothetical protein
MSADTVPLSLLQQALGHRLLDVLREACEAHLTTMLEQLMPQLLATVQEVVVTKTPELLEALLQREIDKLKQAAAADDRHLTE